MANRRGYSTVHTIAGYADVWNKFVKMRKRTGLTANDALEVLLNNYNHSVVENRKASLDNQINLLKEERKSLE